MKENLNNWEQPDRLWNPMFISIFISSILFNLSAQMSNSLLSLYAKSTGAPADQIGTLMSMFALTALIFRFIAGPAMNAYDRKKLLQMAMALFGTAYIGFALSPKIAEITGFNVIHVMMTFRLLQGIGNAFGNACMLTIVSECVPKDRFSSGVGIFALAQSVAQAIGPTVGVKLRDILGYNTTYIIIGLFMYCTIVYLAIIVKVPNRGTGKMALNFENMVAKEALIPAMIVFLVSIGFTAINAFFLVYAEERNIDNASLYFTVNAAALMMTKPLIGKLNDKYGFVKIAIPGILLTAISLILIGYSTQLWHLLAIAVLNSFGYGAVQPAVQSMCMKSVSLERRGSASSTNYIAMDSATLIGPSVCGVVAKAFGYVPMMWSVMAIPCFLGALFTLLCSKKLNQIESDFMARTNSE